MFQPPLSSFYELEDGAIGIRNQVEQIPRLKVELVPVAQRELEVQAATDFPESYCVHDYIGLPQKYWVDYILLVITT
jgi:hypothetical protein